MRLYFTTTTKIFMLILFNLHIYSQETPVQLKWKSVPNQIYYSLQVKSLNNRIIVSKKTDQNQVTVYLKKGKYKYRIATYNKFGKVSIYSQWVYFQVTAIKKDLKLSTKKLEQLNIKLYRDEKFYGKNYLILNNVFQRKLRGIFLQFKKKRTYHTVSQNHCLEKKCIILVSRKILNSDKVQFLLHFNGKRKFQLPYLISIESKPLIIKKNIYEKNKKNNMSFDLNYGVSNLLRSQISSKFQLGSEFSTSFVLDKFKYSFMTPGLGLSYIKLNSKLLNVDSLSNLTLSADVYFRMFSYSILSSSLVTKIAFSSFRLRYMGRSSLFYGTMAGLAVNIKLNLFSQFYLKLSSDAFGFLDLGNTWFFSTAFGLGYKF